MAVSTEFQPQVTEHLVKLFEPNSIAIVGASQTRTKWGYRFISNISRGKFTGRLYGVNPQHAEIRGTPIVPSVAELPEAVDLAYIIVPPPSVAQALRECAARGIKTVVIITAGFGELENDETKAAQREIAAIARDEGLAVVGPNCAGVCSPEPNSLFGAMFTWERAKAGGLSIVSQSGNVAATILRWSALHQVGISRIVSSGNEAACTTEDFLCFYGDDDRTKVIFAYIEGVPNGRRLFEALRYAAERKPVVVMKGGRSPAGVKAAASHTGSLATTMDLFRAACRQAGASLVQDVYEAAELCAAFVNQPLPKGRRTVVITGGGGWGVLAADALHDAGMDVVELDGETVAALDEFLPGWWSRGNPVDLVAGARDPRDSTRVAEIVLKSPVVDALLFLGVGGGVNRSRREKADSKAPKRLPDSKTKRLVAMFKDADSHNNHKLCELIDTLGKPIVAASESILSAYGEIPNASIQEIEGLGLPVSANVIPASRTLAHLAERYEFLQGIPRKRGVRV